MRLTFMPSAPRVTVVVPCRNQAHFLGAALASAARQTWRVDTLVVDDGSTDETASVAQASGAVLLRQPPLGLSAARNQGLRAADGEYVIFLDADDELVPDAVESGVRLLERDRLATMVARCCRLIDEHGRDLPTNCPPPAEHDLYAAWLRRNLAWTPGAVVFRRAPLAAIGGFPDRVGPASDYAVYLRLARTSRVLFDARDAVLYRQHGGNMSRDAALMLRATLQVLRAERPSLPPGYGRAYREGLRAWRTFYGEQIVQQLRTALRLRRFGARELAAAGLLARECSGLLVQHIARKLSRVARGLPPTEVEPGRFPVGAPVSDGESAGAS